LHDDILLTRLRREVDHLAGGEAGSEDAMPTSPFESSNFRKSTFSPPSDGGCVEVAFKPGLIGLRDSKDRGGGAVLLFNAVEWQAFLDGVKAGEFDLP
jgi:hypothetical protein